MHRALVTMARTGTANQRPQGWFCCLVGTSVPPSVIGLDRFIALDVHQLGAGHWAGSTSNFTR